MCTDASCRSSSLKLLHNARSKNWRRLLRGHPRFRGALDERVNEIQFLDDGVNDDLRHQVDETHRPVEFVDEQADLLETLDQRLYRAAAKIRPDVREQMRRGIQDRDHV